jgi:hypothetical protein
MNDEYEKTVGTKLNESALQNALNEQGIHLEQLSAQIGKLEKRLESLRLGRDQSEGRGTDVAVPARSEIVGRISGNTDSVMRLSSRITSLLEELEV